MLETVKEPNCAQSSMLSYFMIYLLLIPSARCTGAFVERERERERERETDRQTDRQRETERERDRKRETESLHLYIYI